MKPIAIVIAPFQLIHHRCGLLARRGTFGYLHSSTTKCEDGSCAHRSGSGTLGGTYQECAAAMARIERARRGTAQVRKSPDT